MRGPLAALGGAALLGLRGRGARVLALVTTGATVLPVLVLAQLLETDGEKVSGRAAAPGREDRLLVVVRTRAGIDPVSDVYVQQGAWPRERRWLVGSFNADSEVNELVGAEWTGPDRIRMTTREGRVQEVAIAAGGSPDRTVTAGWGVRS